MQPRLQPLVLQSVAANADRRNVAMCLINQLSTENEEKVLEKKDLLSHTVQTLLCCQMRWSDANKANKETENN